VFTDSAPLIQLEYWETENHNLIDDVPNKRGVYTFEIKASLKDYPLMDELIEIKRIFTLTITDICFDESINSPTLADMVFKIQASPKSVVNDFASYTDKYSEFCGRLEYTLKYLSGPVCKTWDPKSSECTKALSLVVMD
jgi:hypothetical protein